MREVRMPTPYLITVTNRRAAMLAPGGTGYSRPSQCHQVALVASSIVCLSDTEPSQVCHGVRRGRNLVGCIGVQSVGRACC